MEQVHGYKVFKPDFTCMGYKYEVGKTYTHKGIIGIWQAGFHFCKNLKDCFKYYDFNPKNKVAQVVALGKTISEGNTSVTNKIKIIKELSWCEVLDLVNIGEGNTGFCNAGDCNTGNRNVGSHNSGSCNSGNGNVGNDNTGNKNTGNKNTGNNNTGSYNVGICNVGICNVGNFNTGEYNAGDRNSGMFNSCNYANGLFNSKSPEILMFNKPTKMTFEEFREKYSKTYNLLCCLSLELTQWIDDYKMTAKEKEAHPEYKTTGGYLKKKDYKEACKEMWDNLSETRRDLIKKLPNFNKDVFFEITGIEV